MAEIDDLISQVGDDQLRADLARAANALRANKKFGLVYERHLPETIFVPVDGRVSVGAQVVVRTEPDNATRYVVESVNRSHATISDGETTRKVRHRDLLVVKPFGEPVFPVLRPYGTPVVRGGDKPFHTVINGENFHALQLLLFGYEGKVDCIYIDPPYNSRARDWKYNNDYVDLDDAYRHSKWLSMMEKRLRLAKRLLNPDKSVLILTIDEKEYLRIGMLLEELFPEAEQQMVSSVINPTGVSRGRQFKRSDEYLFIVFVGSAGVLPLTSEQTTLLPRAGSEEVTPNWNQLMRSGTNARRSDRPNLFFPIFVRTDGLAIEGVGDPLPLGMDKDTVQAPDGTVAVWPIRRNGTEGNWQLGPTALVSAAQKGYVKLGRFTPTGMAISYLPAGEQSKVESGFYKESGRDASGAIIAHAELPSLGVPTTVWVSSAHAAPYFGSQLLSSFLPENNFPFPKSLYAVEDVLRFFIAGNDEAVVLDFFSGSGTTAHAVARLNRQDGGERRAILITNNEVSDDERNSLISDGHSPGDDAWEDVGIFRNVTVPRVRAAFTGQRADGTPVPGDYKFTDEFPMADGFEENAAFFTLTYADPDAIETGKRFEDVLPALWLAAGAVGDVTQMKPTAEWFMDPAANFAVLLDEDRFAAFRKELAAREDISHVWLVTNSTSSFARMSSRLDDSVHVGMLYRDYLRNFRLNMGEAV